MPFSTLSTSLSQRIFDAQKALNVVRDAEKRYADRTLDAQTFHGLKGVFYVPLYGCVEHCWSGIVDRFLSEVARRSKPMHSLGPGLASLAAGPLFQSAAEQGRIKKFIKRHEIATLVRSASAGKFVAGLLQSETTAVNGSLVDDLWILLDFPGQPFSSRADWSIINEIFERRCAVAHGREAPSEVGRGAAVTDLASRMTLVQELTSDWIGVAGSALATL